ncbi:MAG: MFS transporter [Pseudomonadota bacterium]
MDIAAGKFEGTDLRSAIAVIISITIIATGIGLSMPLISLLMEEEGLSSTLIGANTLMIGLSSIVAVPYITSFAQRFGVVRLMIANAVFAASMMLAHYWTPILPGWFIWRFLFSVNMTFLFVLGEFWINHSAGETRRGLLLGLYGTISSMGFAAGPAIITIVGINGIRPFAIGAGLFLLAIIPILFVRKNQPVIDKTEQRRSILPYVFMVPLATFAALVFGASETTEFSLLPVYATRAGYEEASAATILTIMVLGNVIFQIPLGILSDRVSDRRFILMICVVGGLVGALMLPFLITNWLAVCILVFLWGGMTGGLYTVGLAHLGSRLTGADLAQANAAFVLCYAIGAMMGPQLVGIAMDLDNNSGFGFGLGLAFFFVIYLIFYAFRIRAR